MSNIFDYNPIQEWNGKVIDFGTGNSQKNYDITSMVTSVEGAQEATSLVDRALYDAETYREINRVIRLFFSGQPLDVEISDWGGNVGEIFEININFSLDVSIVLYNNLVIPLDEPNVYILNEHGYNYYYSLIKNTTLPKCEIFLDKKESFRTSAKYPLFTPTGCYTNDFSKPRLSENSNESCTSMGAMWLEGTYDTPFYLLKEIEGPRTYSYTTSHMPNGDPFVDINWYDGALDSRCSDFQYTDQASCESNSTTMCLGANGQEVMADRYNGQLSPAFSTQTKCEVFSSWQGRGCYYSSNKVNWYWSYINNVYGVDITEEECWSYSNNSYYYVLHEPGNVWDIDYHSWWPSMHTQATVQQQILYEGDSMYHYPTIYNDTVMPAVHTERIEWNDLSANGKKRRGRQTRLFWIGYGLTHHLEDHRTLIDPSKYLKVTFPEHFSVQNTNSRPSSAYGYTNQYGKTMIEWKAPQWGTSVNARTYPTPDYYRIYRSNYYRFGITSPTDYTEGIKHLVGEVPHTEDEDRMYFEEYEADLRAEGLFNNQYAYYWVTAVWTNFTMGNKGLDASLYNGYFNDNISWFDTAVPNSTTRWHSINHNSGGNKYSYKVVGYFRASTTGIYNFRLHSDDASYLWIGSSGTTYGDLEGSATISNSLISNGGLHPPYSVSGNISLVADTYYPILMYYGEWTGGQVFELFFTPPNGIEQTSGHGYFFMDDSDVTNGYNTDGVEREGHFTANNNCRSYYL